MKKPVPERKDNSSASNPRATAINWTLALVIVLLLYLTLGWAYFGIQPLSNLIRYYFH